MYSVFLVTKAQASHVAPNIAGKTIPFRNTQGHQSVAEVLDSLVRSNDGLTAGFNDTNTHLGSQKYRWSLRMWMLCAFCVTDYRFPL